MLFDDNQGLIFGFTPIVSNTQPPQKPENPQSETQPDEPIELVVTGQDTYRVEEASTATRTDTPLRDIPQSIQVIPRQVIDDQQIQRIADVLRLPANPSLPYQAGFFDATNQLTRLFIHPYTGEIMGWIESDSSIERVILKLQYGLLSGRIGEIIVGMAGLLLCILSLTGLFLWNCWRKLLAGFKIKWNAHPKRVNFDIHKVVGIIATVFLTLTAFTGLCWNFSDFSYPVIYAVTFTRQLPEVTSKVISSQSPLQLSQLLENSNTIFPNATTFSVSIPNKADDAVYIQKRQVHETMFYGQSGVYLDRFSGMLRVVDSRKQLLGESILAAFEPLHYGTFGGVLTRIFYVFVGLAPLILFVTGFMMWWYRSLT